ARSRRGASRSGVALDGRDVLPVVVLAAGWEVGALRPRPQAQDRGEQPAPDDDDREHEQDHGLGAHRASSPAVPAGRRAALPPADGVRPAPCTASPGGNGGHGTKSSGLRRQRNAARTSAATTTNATVPQPTSARYQPGYPS